VLFRSLYATGDKEVAHYVELLQLLRTQLVDSDDLFVLQMAVRAQARLEASRGENTRAYALLRTLFEAGLSSSTSRHAGDCFNGEIAMKAGNMSEAKPALERCARHDAAGEKGARARLWLAFADSGQTTAFRLGLVQHLERISPGRLPARESQRLALIKRLPRGSQPPDASQLFLLEAQFEEPSNDTAEGRAEALDALASYLLAIGRAAEAEEVLNRHGSVFFDAGEESEATLVRLRLASLVHHLRPIEARTYAERATAEAGPMPARIKAEIALLQAQNFVVLGQWFDAAHHVRDGIEMAKQAGDRVLEQALSELATSVPLPMNP
jgi:tetratricopeptide (TPR) repeat protein